MSVRAPRSSSSSRSGRCSSIAAWWSAVLCECTGRNAFGSAPASSARRAVSSWRFRTASPNACWISAGEADRTSAGQRVSAPERGRDRRGQRLAARDERLHDPGLPMRERRLDRARGGGRAGGEEDLDERELEALLARWGARHHELERIVEVGAQRAALDHHARDVDDPVRHALHERRVVRDEPEQLGIAEVLLPLRVPVALRLDDALAEQVRLGVEEARERLRVAVVDGLHGRAERRIADHRAVEQLGDRGAILGASGARRVERRPARAVRLPLERALADQELDERERPARGGGVERRLAGPVVARARPRAEERGRDLDTERSRRIRGARAPERSRGILGRAVRGGALREKAEDAAHVARARGDGERRERRERATRGRRGRFGGRARSQHALHQIAPRRGPVLVREASLRVGELQARVLREALGLLAEVLGGGPLGKIALSRGRRGTWLALSSKPRRPQAGRKGRTSDRKAGRWAVPSPRTGGRLVGRRRT